jgi:hypothetical protein
MEYSSLSTITRPDNPAQRLKCHQLQLIKITGEGLSKGIGAGVFIADIGMGM